MSDKSTISANEALDNFFEIVREEAAANPMFGRRLLEAIGHTVQYRGEEALAAIDPVAVARQGYDEFRRTFMSMKLKEIKKVGEVSGLFMKGNKYPAAVGPLVDALWERADEKRAFLAPRRREAAE